MENDLLVTLDGDFYEIDLVEPTRQLPGLAATPPRDVVGRRAGPDSFEHDIIFRAKPTACAEGIEDAVAFARLRELGCDGGQGFHFSKALPSTKLLALLRSRDLGDRRSAARAPVSPKAPNGGLSLRHRHRPPTTRNRGPGL